MLGKNFHANGNQYQSANKYHIDLDIFSEADAQIDAGKTKNKTDDSDHRNGRENNILKWDKYQSGGQGIDTCSK